MPVDVDAETLVDEILVPFRASHPIAAVVDAATVVADRLHLEQVLRYLVLNATKHGGSRIGVVGLSDGANYVFSVVDNGLREKDHPRGDSLRGPVSGARPSRDGRVELSLAVVRELARRMEWDVSQIRVDGYTTFTVCVPLAGGIVVGRPEMRKAG